MNRTSKSVLAVGGAIMAAGLISFTNPKTVHALAAALVQVTNTASNPVVTQSVNRQAAQMVHIACLPSDPDGNCMLTESPASYTNPQTPYVVPAGQSLVITAVDIFPVSPYETAGCNLIHQDVLSAADLVSVTVQFWLVYNTTMHMVYPSGMAFPSGTTLSQSVGYQPNAPSACWYRDRMELYGYLTAS